MSKGPSWFNVTVFVLTRRPLQASFLAAVTFASWLLLLGLCLCPRGLDMGRMGKRYGFSVAVGPDAFLPGLSYAVTDHAQGPSPSPLLPF